MPPLTRAAVTGPGILRLWAGPASTALAAIFALAATTMIILGALAVLAVLLRSLCLRASLHGWLAWCRWGVSFFARLLLRGGGNRCRTLAFATPTASAAVVTGTLRRMASVFPCLRDSIGTACAMPIIAISGSGLNVFCTHSCTSLVRTCDRMCAARKITNTYLAVMIAGLPTSSSHV